VRPDLLPTTLAGMLSHVMQEAGETVTAGSKIQMFGWTHIDPLTKIKYDNDKNLRRELMDLKLAISRLESEMKKRGM
jgi:hypothetical protein